jgi:hypothetical protein
MFVNESIQGHSKVEKAKKPNYNESFFCMRDRTPDDPTWSRRSRSRASTSGRATCPASAKTRSRT